MFVLFDWTGNETLDFETFLLLIIRLRAVSEQRRIVEEEMRKAFRVFDHDGNGLIDKEELRKTMKTLGEKLSKSDVKAMIKSADKNGDGLIDYEGKQSMFLKNKTLSAGYMMVSCTRSRVLRFT